MKEDTVNKKRSLYLFTEEDMIDKKRSLYLFTEEDTVDKRRSFYLLTKVKGKPSSSLYYNDNTYDHGNRSSLRTIYGFHGFHGIIAY
jgi:hypothetical protein